MVTALILMYERTIGMQLGMQYAVNCYYSGEQYNYCHAYAQIHISFCAANFTFFPN